MLDLTFEPPKPKVIEGATGPWELVIGMEIHAQVSLEGQAVLGRLHHLRRRAQLQRVLRRRGDAGDAAGDQRILHRTGGAHRAGAEGADQPGLGLRPQELLLPRPAAGLPDFPALPPDGRRGRGASSRWGRASPARSGSSASMSSRTPASRSTTWTRHMSFVDLNRTGVRADGDRLAPRHPRPRGSGGLCRASCARSCATSAPATATCRTATCAPT